MFCQSCGTENPEDARFCKTCGTSIAQPGDRGGPILDESEMQRGTEPGSGGLGDGSDTIKDDGPPAAVAKSEGRGQQDVETTLAGIRAQSSSSLTNMSLTFASLSLRSPARSYLVALGVIVGLIAVGAGTSYAVMLVYAQNTAVIATSAEVEQETPPPVEVGFPSLDGDDVADLDTGSVNRPRRRSTGSGASSGSGGSGASSGASAEGAGDGASGEQGEASASGGIPGEHRESSTEIVAPETPSGSGGSEGSSSGGSSSETPSEPSTGSGSSGSGSGGGGSTMPPGFDDEVDERDLVMDAYAGQVRRVIRQYYAARAQSCFDRATRNNHNLRGTVVVQFTIGMDGNVSQATPVRNTTGDSELGACLAGQVRSWRLPVPPRDEPVSMQMPFSW